MPLIVWPESKKCVPLFFLKNCKLFPYIPVYLKLFTDSRNFFFQRIILRQNHYWFTKLKLNYLTILDKMTIKRKINESSFLLMFWETQKFNTKSRSLVSVLKQKLATKFLLYIQSYRWGLCLYTAFEAPFLSCQSHKFLTGGPDCRGILFVGWIQNVDKFLWTEFNSKLY
jgi:hypothetical protein